MILKKKTSDGTCFSSHDAHVPGLSLDYAVLQIGAEIRTAFRTGQWATSLTVEKRSQQCTSSSKYQQ